MLQNPGLKRQKYVTRFPATSSTCLISMVDSFSFAIAKTSEEVRSAAATTIMDYALVAKGYAKGNMNHDVLQNIDAMLKPLHASPLRTLPFDVLDVCCASGRDLHALRGLGHNPVGLNGVAEFCKMSREASGCEVWEQLLTDLDLPVGQLDTIFCNACLFHIPHVAGSVRQHGCRHAGRPHALSS